MPRPSLPWLLSKDMVMKSHGFNQVHELKYLEICASWCHGMCQWCAKIQPSKNQHMSWFCDVTSFKVTWKYKLQQLVFIYPSSMSIPSNIIILLSSTTKYHLFRPVQWQCLTSKKYRKVYEHLSILAAVFFCSAHFFFGARCFFLFNQVYHRKSTRYPNYLPISASWREPLLGGLTFENHSWGGQGWEGVYPAPLTIPLQHSRYQVLVVSIILDYFSYTVYIYIKAHTFHYTKQHGFINCCYDYRPVIHRVCPKFNFALFSLGGIIQIFQDAYIIYGVFSDTAQWSATWFPEFMHMLQGIIDSPKQKCGLYSA